jgi:hypothetical protein
VHSLARLQNNSPHEESVYSSVTCKCNFLLFFKGFVGYAVAQFVEALLYNLEGRGFDSRWSHWDFSLA